MTELSEIQHSTKYRGKKKIPHQLLLKHKNIKFRQEQNLITE